MLHNRINVIDTLRKPVSGYGCLLAKVGATVNDITIKHHYVGGNFQVCMQKCELSTLYCAICFIMVHLLTCCTPVGRERSTMSGFQTCQIR